MTLMTLFQVLLARLAGQHDFGVGVQVAGRRQAELEDLVGMFLNTLVMRYPVGEEAATPTWSELVGRVREVALEAYAHQDVPIERLLDELDVDREAGLGAQFRNPLFQVHFNMLNLPWTELDLPGVRTEVLETTALPSKFDITLYANLTDDGLDLIWSYNAELFNAARIEEMAAQYEILFEQVSGDADRPIDAYSLVTPAARSVLPDPQAPLDSTWHGSVHDLFLARAAQAPERIAVVDDDRMWSYGVLASHVAGLATQLADLGIEREDAVLIHAHRSAALSVAILATLSAGGAFVVLDPRHPPRRLARMARQVRPTTVIEMTAAGKVGPELADALSELGCRRLALLPDGSPHPTPLARKAPFRSATVGPADRAIIGFTSGTTGAPRAIECLHGPLTHFLPWQCRAFALGPDDRYSMSSGLAHDPLQRDLFTPLATGATVVIPDPEQRLEPGYLARWMARQRISVTHTSPAMIQLMADTTAGTELVTLRLAFVGGEAFTVRDARRMRRLAPRTEVVNSYGATETQRAVSFFVYAREGAIPDEERGLSRRDALPLGRGIPGVQLLVRRPDGGLAGLGEVGEIHFRSPHLARGYLGEPELTAQRFVNETYRSGDLARYGLDGIVEPLGRADHQVQIRGYRVELGEIETQLVEHPSVLRAVVTLEGERLAAWVVAGPDGAHKHTLRDHLGERLPEYMVPSAFVFLPALPLTLTNKIDRAALDRDLLAAATVAEAPAAHTTLTPVEEVVVGIWESVLEVDGVGTGDHFFRLGGHSLLATRVISRLRDAFDVELPLRCLFETPRLADLAERIEGARRSGRHTAPPLVARAPEGEPELSFAQQRLWFLDRLSPGGAEYNMPAAIRLRGALDVAALEHAFAELVRRHEVLRTSLAEHDGVARQVIHSFTAPMLPVVDVSRLEGHAVQALVDAEAARPFDLERDPLLRAHVLRIRSDDHVLLVTMHHVASDAWSIGVMLRGVAAFYRRTELPEPEVQYADFARWQHDWLSGEILDRQLDYWRERLHAMPALELPADRPRRR